MSKQLKIFIFLAFAFFILLIASSSFDMPLASYFWINKVHTFDDFFNENLYEHGKFGIADIVVLILVGNLLVYGGSFLSATGTMLKPYRSITGFVINAGFTTAVSTVHAMKWGFSRARPNNIVNCFLEEATSRGLSFDQAEHTAQFPQIFDTCQDIWFTPWYMPGNLTPAMGFNKGSFPGGHVATMGALVTLFFLFPSRGKWAPVRWFYLAGVILLQATMGWYRIMSETHWLTDNLASLALSILVPFAYYFFLHFPAGDREKSIVSSRKAGWEFYTIWITLFFLFAIAAIFVGIRMTLHGEWSHGLPTTAAGMIFTVVLAEANLRLLWNRSLLGKKYQRKSHYEFSKTLLLQILTTQS